MGKYRRLDPKKDRGEILYAVEDGVLVIVDALYDDAVKVPWLYYVLEEARHARDKCMSCDKPPTIDVLWAEGIGHAWFCAKCFTVWEKEYPGEVDNTKKIEHGIARMKFSDRTSPESLREECAVKDIPDKGTELSDDEILVLNQRLRQLWKLHFEGNDAEVVKGKGDLTRAQVEAGLETLRAEMEKRNLEEACTIKEVPTRAAGLSDEEILGLNLRLKELWDLHFEGNDAVVVKGKGDLTRAQVVVGLETIRKEMEKRGLSEVAEAGRRVQAKRVKQVKDIIQVWQKLRTELEDWLKWAEYMDGDWVGVPRVKEEDMQELFGRYVTISGTRVFIQEKAPVLSQTWDKAQFASRDREWDADAAEKRIRAWADAEEGPNAKYGRAFFYCDPNNVDNFGGYKLLYMDIVDGKFKVVPRAVFAVFGVLQGARGGLKIPEKDKKVIRKKVEGFYAKMRKEFDDESLGEE